MSAYTPLPRINKQTILRQSIVAVVKHVPQSQNENRGKVCNCMYCQLPMTDCECIDTLPTE